MSSIALDYDIPYNRVYRAVYRNPKGYDNIEKSGFERGAYVGYSPKGKYYIKKFGKNLGWRAIGTLSLSMPPREVTKILHAKNLEEMSRRLRENPLGVRTTTKDERKIPRKFPLYYTGPAPRMPLVYLYDDLTRLMKNRDELLMDFDIRERPGHPYDFIIIAKFRSYVSGARLYSAGLKTKSRIENTLAGFGRLIGYRSKRIGNSDYSYEIFAIRLDKELHKPEYGKLFGNRRSMKGWKIQTASVNGWADVKSSHDGGSRSYQTDYYLTRAEALREMKDFPGRKGSYRVVSATTPAQDDLYD
jgi:hypothetical protein